MAIMPHIAPIASPRPRTRTKWLSLYILALLGGSAGAIAQPVAEIPLEAWQDLPVSPGDWSYAANAQGSVARFGSTNDAIFMIQCSFGANGQAEIYLTRSGQSDGSPSMTIRTTNGSARFAAEAGKAGGIVTALAPHEPILDNMAFSRGRIMIGTPGLPDLVIPDWPELTRVIEDCRAPG